MGWEKVDKEEEEEGEGTVLKEEETEATFDEAKVGKASRVLCRKMLTCLRTEEEEEAEDAEEEDA